MGSETTTIKSNEPNNGFSIECGEKWATIAVVPARNPPTSLAECSFSLWLWTGCRQWADTLDEVWDLLAGDGIAVPATFKSEAAEIFTNSVGGAGQERANREFGEAILA